MNVVCLVEKELDVYGCEPLPSPVVRTLDIVDLLTISNYEFQSVNLHFCVADCIGSGYFFVEREILCSYISLIVCRIKVIVINKIIK